MGSSYKAEFIRFMLDCEVLRFGTFRTKSGRDSPYFINTGLFDTGEKMKRLGEFYAAAIREHFADDYDMLYGPAYKGIPLVVATAIALSESGRGPVPFAFNRKEPKDHGEGGLLVGARPAPGARALIVEDVTTAGTSVHESVELLRREADAIVTSLIVSVDRQEKGPTGARAALAQLEDEYGIRTAAIVTLDDIIAYLPTDRLPKADATLAAIADYRARYGATER